ncbi:MAG: lytic transglycosylase domain-containing protein [Bryobacteraceae bacterium]
MLQAAAPEPRDFKAASVVRTDPRTKRLVRTIAVSGRPRLPQPTVTPEAPESAAIAPEAKLARIEPAEPTPTPAGTSVNQFIRQTADRYQLDPLMVDSVIQVESNYNPFAVSPKGARGLMQLMPETARRLAVKDSFNPWENIDGGVRYLKYLFDLFGDSRLALAAYNAGENAVFKYGGVPPYRETAEYVSKVSRKWNEAAQAAQTVGIPKPAAGIFANPPIAQYVDSEGRLHFETQSTP